MSGPLTTQVIDKVLRAAGLEPWSPENRNGWTVYALGGFFIVTGDVPKLTDALAVYSPEPCGDAGPPAVRVRAQRARHDAVVALRVKGSPEPPVGTSVPGVDSAGPPIGEVGQ